MALTNLETHLPVAETGGRSISAEYADTPERKYARRGKAKTPMRLRKPKKPSKSEQTAEILLWPSRFPLRPFFPSFASFRSSQKFGHLEAAHSANDGNEEREAARDKGPAKDLFQAYGAVVLLDAHDRRAQGKEQKHRNRRNDDGREVLRAHERRRARLHVEGLTRLAELLLNAHLLRMEIAQRWDLLCGCERGVSL